MKKISNLNPKDIKIGDGFAIEIGRNTARFKTTEPAKGTLVLGFTKNDASLGEKILDEVHDKVKAADPDSSKKSRFLGRNLSPYKKQVDNLTFPVEKASLVQGALQDALENLRSYEVKQGRNVLISADGYKFPSDVTELKNLPPIVLASVTKPTVFESDAKVAKDDVKAVEEPSKLNEEIIAGDIPNAHAGNDIWDQTGPALSSPSAQKNAADIIAINEKIRREAAVKPVAAAVPAFGTTYADAGAYGASTTMNAPTFTAGDVNQTVVARTSQPLQSSPTNLTTSSRNTGTYLTKMSVATGDGISAHDRIPLLPENKSPNGKPLTVSNTNRYSIDATKNRDGFVTPTTGAIGTAGVIATGGNSVLDRLREMKAKSAQANVSPAAVASELKRITEATEKFAQDAKTHAEQAEAFANQNRIWAENITKMLGVKGLTL